MNLFAEYGYDSVGVQMLCKKSDLTKPTLYYYFGNKEGLLKEILLVNYEKLNNLLKENAVYMPNPKDYEQDVFPLLNRLADIYFNFVKNNPEFYQLIMQITFAPNSSAIKNLATELNLIQYKIIEQMFISISKVHKNMIGAEKRLAWSFIGLLNTYIALKINDSSKSVVKQFMHGIFS